jgi:hypothetical protein
MERIPVFEVLKQGFWMVSFYFFLLCFAIGIYAVNVMCLVMAAFMAPTTARRVARKVVDQLFRLYATSMLSSGALRANCNILKRLHSGMGGRLIIANHPSMS